MIAAKLYVRSGGVPTRTVSRHEIAPVRLAQEAWRVTCEMVVTELADDPLARAVDEHDAVVGGHNPALGGLLRPSADT
jgi:hypothetical protein